MMIRKIPNVDEMFDILSSMAAGKFATFSYVNIAKIRKTKRGIDLDAFGKDLDDNHTDGDDYWYTPLKQYQQDPTIKKNPIYSIISVTRYNLNWSTEDSFNQKKKDYDEKKREIDKKWGIYKDETEKRKVDFRSVNNGYGVSVGNTDNTRNKAYIHQNIHNAKRITKYFIIDENGDIKGEVPFNAIRHILTKSSDSNVNALLKLGRTDAEVAEYIKEVATLKFKYSQFLVDKILYIVATVNGEKILYVNNRLQNKIDDINVNTEQFINMVKESFKESFNDVNEACKKYKNMIFENKIKKALYESLKKFNIIK